MRFNGYTIVRNSNRITNEAAQAIGKTRGFTPGFSGLWVGVRKNTASGAPTFGVFYSSWRGITVIIDCEIPMYGVKEVLQRIAADGHIMSGYVLDVVKELNGPNGPLNLPDSPKADPSSRPRLIEAGGGKRVVS